jgi:hypothetical protein
LTETDHGLVECTRRNSHAHNRTRHLGMPDSTNQC